MPTCRCFVTKLGLYYEKRKTMNLLILLNGHKDNLFKAQNLNSEDFEVVKIDEKTLAKPAEVLRIIKSKPFKKIYFGCIELELQRFRAFMLLFIFLSFVNKGGLIDELGNKTDYNLFKFIFVVFPLIIIEAIASIIIVCFYYVKLPILKWHLIRKK